MIVTCDQCNARYDDVYQRTDCPHEHFEMCTVVIDGKRPPRIVTSLRELNLAIGINKRRE